MRSALIIGGLIWIYVVLLAEHDDRVFVGSVDHPAIQYSTRSPHDPVNQLNLKLTNGDAILQFDPAQGYLPSVLKALKVPRESQITVFTKTGIQADVTGPKNPRAIFFNDNVVIEPAPVPLPQPTIAPP